MKYIKYLKKIASHKKTILLSAITLLSVLSIMSVGPTYAYLKFESAHYASNTMGAASSVNPTVTDNQINVGATDYSVYVRAAVVINWKKGNSVLAEKPMINVDYTLEENDGWTKQGDGFYLYNSVVTVESGLTIAVPAIVNAVPGIVPPEEGYTLSVDFLVQTIQSAGTTDGTDSGVKAIKDAWEYDV